MAIGFVHVKTAPAAERAVYNALKDLEEAVEIHTLFGEYDLIVKLEAEDIKDIGNIVVDKIEAIEGVEDTKTLIGMDF